MVSTPAARTLRSYAASKFVKGTVVALPPLIGHFAARTRMPAPRRSVCSYASRASAHRRLRSHRACSALQASWYRPAQAGVRIRSPRAGRRSTIASLQCRHRELAADDRSRVEIAVTLAVAERIEVDPAAFVARESESASGLKERVQAKFVSSARQWMRQGRVHRCLRSVDDTT
jgi:hypothetical protein